ncbi:MAG TPA: phosphatidate cytidylyltransferase [Frankiaceae bacterium]|jgi:phosphatidate cytidylyltransferase|nr:phosphatidate cytidylyltransferase [Frankiaceae bacterium]
MSVAEVPSPAEVPDVGEKPVPSKAGRNLPAAIAVGLTLGALILGTLFTERRVFAAVIAAAVGIGILELSRALRENGMRAARTPLVVGGAVTIGAAYQRGSTALLFGLVATCLACLAWRLADGGPGVVRDWSASVFVAAYVPFLAGFAALMTAPENGAARIVAFIATTVCSDVGGYVAGVLKGRHPMAPSVSPKKTWEGFAGSTVACVVCGIALVSGVMEIAWWEGGLFGLAVVGAATVGDLGESLVKRDVGIKDMGHLLPGHGGIMDRLDSLLAVAPVAWMLLTLWAPVR